MTASLLKQPSVKRRLLRSFDFRFGKAALTRPSVLALLAANVFPIVGVVFLGWDVFLVLALFWAENLVIGFYTALKMLLVSNARWGARCSAAVFFCVHYGLFTLVHGVFVFVVFGGQIMNESSSGEAVSAWQRVAGSQLWWGGLALIISHGISFFYNYVGAGEYRRSSLNAVMQEPYGRVVLLHLTIIFGGFLVMLLGSPVAGLLLLVILKAGMDIRAHLRQHDRYSAQASVTA